MYRIIKVSDGTEIGVTDTIEFIRYGNSGCFVPADQKHAIGVAVNSVPYNLVGHDEIEGAETVVVSEIDGGAVLAKQGSLVDDLILSALGVQNLRNMYEEGLLDTTGLLNAVAKDWITITDVIEIVGEDNALSVVMSAKLSEISNACNAVIVNGVDIKFGEENVHFNLSIEDQSNINNLFRVVELGGTEFPYQADGGVCRIYTAAEIAAIYIAAQTLITTQTTYHNELKQYVQTLTSAEEVSAIQYGMTLPEPYLTEMNEKLAVAQQQMQAIVGRMQQAAATNQA